LTQSGHWPEPDLPPFQPASLTRYDVGLGGANSVPAGSSFLIDINFEAVLKINISQSPTERAQQEVLSLVKKD
jgi:hypothetical protein